MPIVPDRQRTITCIVGAYYIFTTANAPWREAGKKKWFKIEWAGVSKKVEFESSLMAGLRMILKSSFRFFNLLSTTRIKAVVLDCELALSDYGFYALLALAVCPALL